MNRSNKIQTIKTQQPTNNQQNTDKIDDHTWINNKIKGIKPTSSSTHSYIIGNNSHYIRCSDYETLKENKRIIKRIINPKRDKIILGSIEAIKKDKNSNIRAKTEHRNRRTTLSKQKQLKQSEIQRKSSHNLYTQLYQLKLENERMGKRIVQTKSTITGSLHRQASCGRINTNYRINKGVFIFFNQEIQENKPDITNFSQKTNLSTKKYQMKQYYGFGPTLLCINAINIFTNPILKDEDLLFLQLIVNSDGINKAYQTNIVSYKVLSNSKIKFALSLNKIGQYVPLRVWRVHQLSHIQLGIVDIQFSKYIHQQNQVKHNRTTTLLTNSIIQNNLGGFNNINGLVVQVNRQGRVRTFVNQKIQTKLRKTRIDEVHSSISLQYAIYRKRYF